MSGGEKERSAKEREALDRGSKRANWILAMMAREYLARGEKDPDSSLYVIAELVALSASAQAYAESAARALEASHGIESDVSGRIERCREAVEKALKKANPGDGKTPDECPEFCVVEECSNVAQWRFCALLAKDDDPRVVAFPCCFCAEHHGQIETDEHNREILQTLTEDARLQISDSEEVSLDRVVALRIFRIPASFKREALKDVTVSRVLLFPGYDLAAFYIGDEDEESEG